MGIHRPTHSQIARLTIKLQDKRNEIEEGEPTTTKELAASLSEEIGFPVAFTAVAQLCEELKIQLPLRRRSKKDELEAKVEQLEARVAALEAFLHD